MPSGHPIHARLLTLPCHCSQRGYITDQASESLHTVRSKRADNKGRLRTLMDEQVGRSFDPLHKGGQNPSKALIMLERALVK